MKLYVGTKGLVLYNQKVLLIRESTTYKDGSRAGKWDVPGGRIDSDEDLQAGLKREVWEECGLKVAPGEIVGAFDGYPDIRGEKCHVVRLYFVCQARTDQVVLSQDHDMFAWVDPSDPGDRELMADIEEMLDKTAVLIGGSNTAP